MQKSDVVKLFKAITSAYPGEKGFSSADMDAVNIWAAMLGDIPYERVILALQAHISESPYPPKISDIRKWALSPPMPDTHCGMGVCCPGNPRLWPQQSRQSSRFHAGRCAFRR